MQARLTDQELLTLQLEQLPWPLRIEELATRLGCGVRWIRDFIRQYPLGRRAGRTLLFDRADFERLWAALPSAAAAGNVDTVGLRAAFERPARRNPSAASGMQRSWGLGKSEKAAKPKAKKRDYRRGPRGWSMATGIPPKGQRGANRKQSASETVEMPAPSKPQAGNSATAVGTNVGTADDTSTKR